MSVHAVQLVHLAIQPCRSLACRMCKIMTLTRTMPQLSTLLQAANMTLLNTTTASSAKVCCGACRMTELQVSSFSEGHAL